MPYHCATNAVATIKVLEELMSRIITNPFVMTTVVTTDLFPMSDDIDLC